MDSLREINDDKVWNEQIRLECAEPLKQSDVDSVQQMSVADALALEPFVEKSLAAPVK